MVLVHGMCMGGAWHGMVYCVVLVGLGGGVGLGDGGVLEMGGYLEMTIFSG